MILGKNKFYLAEYSSFDIYRKEKPLDSLAIVIFLLIMKNFILTANLYKQTSVSIY